MFKWFFGNKTNNDSAKRIGEIKTNKEIELSRNINLDLIEANFPILFDFKYTVSVRCGLGFDYNQYTLEVSLTEITRHRLTVKCECCGKPVHLFTITEVMTNAVTRMGIDRIHNSSGYGLNGHSLGNVTIDPELVERYDNEIDSLVRTRDWKMFF